MAFESTKSNISTNLVLVVFLVGLFLASLLCGSHSLTPLIWNDSTSFVISAIRSIQYQATYVQDGVNLGYVLILAGVVQGGFKLSALILIQHLFWAFSVALCGYTLARLTNAKRGQLVLFAVPLLLMASYPGIQIYNNLIMAESLYTAAITCALCFTLLAWHGSSNAVTALFIAAALLFSGYAALTKAQGVGPFFVIAIACLVVACRSWKTLVVGIFTIAIVLVGVWFGNSLRANAPDQTSALFGSKTLFCMHLDLVLKAKSTQKMLKNSFGADADAVEIRLDKHLHNKTGEYKTLGFYADDCQFDKEMDTLGVRSYGGDVEALAAWYRNAFVAAVLENPSSYLKKVLKQLLYGLKMAMPPHGLGEKMGEVHERKLLASEMFREAGFGERGLSSQEVTLVAPLMGRYTNFTNLVLRCFSLLIALSLVGSIVMLLYPKSRHQMVMQYAAIASLVWFSQIGIIALTHTLDIWRYIIPVVPAGVLSFSLVAYFCFIQIRGSTGHSSKLPTDVYQCAE